MFLPWGTVLIGKFKVSFVCNGKRYDTLSNFAFRGLKSKIASCSAVQASMEYLSRALFSSNNIATNTNQIFVSLLRSFWEAQDFILEAEGHLTTLTVAVILPLADSETHKNKYVCCSCNVGDSLGYVYSKKHGVREFTLGQ